jgi:hypothetical protein
VDKLNELAREAATTLLCCCADGEIKDKLIDATIIPLLPYLRRAYEMGLLEPGTRFWRDADGNVCSKIGDDGGDVSPFVGAIRNGSLKQRPVEPVGQKTVTELSEEPIPHLGEMVFGPPKKKNEPVEKPQLPEEICDKIIRLESRLAARDAEIKELKKDIEANDIILEGSIDADNIIINAKNKEIAALGAENERLSRWRSRVYRRLTRYTQSLGLKLDISNIDWKKAP